MGSSQAKAKIDSQVQSTINTYNTTSQSCLAKQVNNNNITINCKNISGTTIEVDSNSLIDVSCLQTATISNDIKQSIINDFKNTATGIVSGMGVGGADASAIVDSSVNLGVNLTNNVIQQCAGNADITNGIAITCDNLTGSYVRISDLSQNLSDCVQQSNTSNSVTETVDQTISNAATAEVEGISAMIILIIAVVIGLVILFFASDWKLIVAIIIIIIVVIVIYLIIANNKGWTPFNKKSTSSSSWF